ncbi:MAG: peptide ABC transporter substrate-binding protein [Candidatus Kerfeldbacteria bacterium]|nr:peptide ABC transporter substrate-binding protein [Candidatus Kerfeldbacteria bacterium]
MINPLPSIIRRLRSGRGKPAAGPAEHDPVADRERALVHTLAKGRLPSLRQLRYLAKVLPPSEFFLIRALGGFVIVALLFLGVRVYARSVTHLPRPGGEVVEALVGTPQYINPILLGTNDVDRDLSRLLFAGLLKRNERQEIVPSLAESVDISQDKKIYTVILRAGLRWSDGEPLNIEDVLLTFTLIQDQLYKSPLRSQFRNVKVERVDERTVRFTLSQASAGFLSGLTVGIVPAHIWGDVPPSSFALVEYNIKPVGAGPFAFESLKRDGGTGAVKEFRLVRNQYYHGHPPYLDRLTLKIFPEMLSAIDALQSKRVESVSVVPSDVRGELKQVQSRDLQLPRYTALFFNGRRNLLKPIEVRRALAQATPRTDLVNDVLHGAATIVDGPFASALPGHAGQLQPAYDSASANSTLEAAGWTKPEGSSIRKKGNDELTLTITVVDQTEDLDMVEMIKRQWESVGVKVYVKPVDATLIAKDIIKPRDYDVLLYGEILPGEGDLYPFWHSSQDRDPGLNLTTFFNKDADKLLEELRATADPAVVSEKRIAFQRLLAEQLPAIFLYSPYYTYGLAKRVHGFDVQYVTSPADRFANIEGWYVKTKLALK